MRRATAYSSSCLQVVLVYLHLFYRNSLFKCSLQPKNRQKLLKTLILRTQNGSRSSTLIPLKVRHQCLLW